MAIGRPISLTPNVATKAISAVATANQTEFTVTGGYRINEISVYRNGVRLAEDRDFTASDGDTVTLTSGATVDDLIEFVIFDSFNVSSAIVSAASSQTLNGNLNVTGTLYGGGLLLSGSTNLNVGILTASTALHVGSAITANAAGDVDAVGIITAAGGGTFGGAVNVDATTDSTSSTTGALIVDGGLGVAKNVYIGAGLSVAGTLTYEDVTSVDSVGLITAKSGVNITGGQLTVGSGITMGIAGVATFADGSSTANALKFGSGGDLTIYHDGSHSYIKDSGTGELRLSTSQFTVQNAAGNETLLYAVDNAGVGLKYQDNLKLETTNTGVNVTGVTVDDGATHDGDVTFTGANYDLTWDKSANVLLFDDNTSAKFGTGGDLKIHHDGTDNYLEAASSTLHFRIASGNRLSIDGTSGDVSMQGASGKNVQWDNSAASLIFNDNAKAIFGTSSDGVEIYHDGSHSYIKDTGTGYLRIQAADYLQLGTSSDSDYFINCDATTGYVYVNSAGNTKLQTTNNGTVTTGIATATDFFVNTAATKGLKNTDTGQRLIHQASNETRIYHASNAQVKLTFRGTGDTYRGAVNADANGMALLTGAASEEYGVLCVADGATNLYYDAGLRLATTDDGVTIQKGLTVKGEEGGVAQIRIEADEADDSSDRFRLVATDGSGFSIQSYDGSQYDELFKGVMNGATTLYHNNNAKLATSSTGVTVTGTVSDTKGDLRQIIYQNKTSGYTLVASDAGKAIHISTGGVTINNSLFSAGDAVTIVNNSGSDQTITQGSGVTLYNSSDGSTGNKTLSGRGMATVWFSSASVGYISGNI